MFTVGIAVIVKGTLAIPEVREYVLERCEALVQYQEEHTWSGWCSIWQRALQVITSNSIAMVGAENLRKAAVGYPTFVLGSTTESGEELQRSGKHVPVGERGTRR